MVRGDLEGVNTPSYDNFTRNQAGDHEVISMHEIEKENCFIIYSYREDGFYYQIFVTEAIPSLQSS